MFENINALYQSKSKTVTKILKLSISWVQGEYSEPHSEVVLYWTLYSLYSLQWRTTSPAAL